jgi:glucose-6-phosphate 1-dehydrogenase
MNPQSKATTIILFGATGDLAKLYLLPSLYDLYTRSMLPEDFHIVAFARKDFCEETFRQYVIDEVKIEDKDFLKHIKYVQGDMMKEEGYDVLGKFLNECDAEIGVCSNKLFYLAIPPQLFDNVFDHLKKSGLTTPCANSEDDAHSWARVLVEKPFGFDQEEAQYLDTKLGAIFDENQIYRIDHYLAKETVQNILTFRFANVFFDPAWNHEYIESVEILMHESVTVVDRGSFFDGIGALRDVGQNHLLQMLALIAMEDPKHLDQDKIREARAEVLSNLTIKKDSEGTYQTKRARYQGYKETEGVASDSNTETFFRVELLINNDRWQGVPFILESGKGLPKKHTEIKVNFKERASCVCEAGDAEHANQIVFRIQPDEGITAKFWAKKPGFTFDIEEKDLSFDYSKEDRLPNAYERVLFDAIRGDQTLFASTDEVTAQWNIIMPILKQWKEEDDQGKVMGTYQVGELPEGGYNKK